MSMNVDVNYRQLNASSCLFIGGMPDDVARATRGRFRRGLDGCVSHVILGANYHVHLTKDAHDGRNIEPCAVGEDEEDEM